MSNLQAVELRGFIGSWSSSSQFAGFLSGPGTDRVCRLGRADVAPREGRPGAGGIVDRQDQAALDPCALVGELV